MCYAANGMSDEAKNLSNVKIEELEAEYAMKKTLG